MGEGGEGVKEERGEGGEEGRELLEASSGRLCRVQGQDRFYLRRQVIIRDDKYSADFS